MNRDVSLDHCLHKPCIPARWHGVSFKRRPAGDGAIAVGRQTPGRGSSPFHHQIGNTHAIPIEVTVVAQLGAGDGQLAEQETASGCSSPAAAPTVASTPPPALPFGTSAPDSPSPGAATSAPRPSTSWRFPCATRKSSILKAAGWKPLRRETFSRPTSTRPC
jgi:hypothetical protein